MREKQLFDIRSKIGMLFQESALFDSLNIQENVAYPLVNQPSIKCPPGEVLPRVKQTLEFVELGGTLAKFPMNFRAACAARGHRRRGHGAAASNVRSPTAGLDPITGTPSWRC